MEQKSKAYSWGEFYETTLACEGNSLALIDPVGGYSEEQRKRFAVFEALDKAATVEEIKEIISPLMSYEINWLNSPCLDGIIFAVLTGPAESPIETIIKSKTDEYHEACRYFFSKKIVNCSFVKACENGLVNIVRVFFDYRTHRPKLPRTSYNEFCLEMMPIIKYAIRKKTGLKGNELGLAVASEIEERWKNISTIEREKYNHIRDEKKREYEEKMRIHIFDFEDSHINSALVSACEEGYTELVKLLLEKGADIHTEESNSLRRASKHGHIEIVKLLLENGANIHAGKDSALYVSCVNGHTDIVKLLVEKGADIYTTSALQQAAYKGHIEIAKFLLSTLRQREKFPEKEILSDILNVAAQRGHFEITKLMLENGADIHYNNDVALRVTSSIEIAKLLLQYGANVHAEDDEALRSASESGETEIVKILLENGADLHAVDGEALMSASECGYTEIVKLLLEKGANVHCSEGVSIVYASINNKWDTVAVLLQYGANVNLISKDALSLVCSTEKQLEIVKLLLQYGIVIPEKIVTRVFQCDFVQLFKLFLEHNVNIDHLYDKFRNRIEMVEMLGKIKSFH